MDAETVARGCRALGDATRVQIIGMLAACCRPLAIDDDGGCRDAEGPTVGEVCCRVTGAPRATSSFSFHIKVLREAGLITVERRGRHQVCRLNSTALTALLSALHPAGLCFTPDRDEPKP